MKTTPKYTERDWVQELEESRQITSAEMQFFVDRMGTADAAGRGAHGPGVRDGEAQVLRLREGRGRHARRPPTREGDAAEQHRPDDDAELGVRE